MSRHAIAPFRLEPPGPRLDTAGLLRLATTPDFPAFLELLREPVVLLQGDGRIIAMNRIASAHLGQPTQQAGAAWHVPENVTTALSTIAHSATPGPHRMPRGFGRSPQAPSAFIQALPGGAGQDPLYVITFEPSVDSAPPYPQPPQATPETNGALLYQPRLEPIIKLGVRAFRARRRILLLGETGVGKTTLVKSMHRQVNGPSPPFIHVNCSSISETLFEAEMFGYERGAFTGALAGGKMGFIEAAAGGTLFLDEVGELTLQQQAKLLKFLEDGTVQPVGSVKPKQVDVFVVCATNRDLWADVRDRRFREDLYYRIAMIPVEVPPLRQAPEELPALVDTLIANLNLGRSRKLSLTADCRRLLVEHHYPGNIRELLGLIARLDLLADDTADADLLPASMRAGSTPAFRTDAQAAEPGTLKDKVRAFERTLIDEAMRGARSKRQAAKALGIDIASLLRKLQD